MTTFDKDPLYGPLPELTGEEKDIYTIDALDQWRADEHRRLDVLRAIGGFSDTYVTTYIESIDATLDRRLQEAGISPDSDGYSEIWNTYRDVTIDKVSDDEWGNSPKSRGVDDTDTKPYREKVRDQIAIRMNGIDNESATARYFEQRENLESELAEHTEDAAISFAQRMKAGVFSRRKGNYEDEFTTSQQHIEELLKQRSEIEVDQLRRERLTDEEIADRIAEFENDQSKNSAVTQRDAMLGKFEQNDTRRAKLRAFGRKALDVYGNLSTGKKVAVSVVAGGAMIGAGAAAAATGGAVLAGSAALLGGARFGRAYFMSRSKLYEAPKNAHEVTAKNEDGSYKSIEDIIAQGKELRQQNSQERFRDGDKKKKIALGLTALAATGISFGALHIAYDHSDSFRHGVNGLFDHSSPNVEQSIPKVDPPAPESPNLPQGEQPVQLPVAGENDNNISIYSNGAGVIGSGEGWYQTFSELGVTNIQDQAKLLNDDVLMGKLANMGVAYPDSSIGGWGIRMTPDGKMPVEALKLIQSTINNFDSVR